jgi:hypothetical protein
VRHADARPGDYLDQPSVVGLGEGQLVAGQVEAVVPAVDPRRLAQQPRAGRLPRHGRTVSRARISTPAAYPSGPVTAFGQ